MVAHFSLLVTLAQLVDQVPLPAPSRPGRGRPCTYSDRLFLKAMIIMQVRHLHTAYELLTVLAQPTAEMQTLRALLAPEGHFPCRRTWERRLQRLPTTWPALIGCFGRHLALRLQPFATCGRAVAIDSTLLRAFLGHVWHQKDRAAGVVPHSGIDTEAA